MFNTKVRNIEFELTNRCNAACPLCSRTGKNKGALSDTVHNSGWKDIPVDIHKSVLDCLDWSSVDAIDYGGCFGDPLMHPQILQILKNGEGLYQEVQTNASLQTQKFWKESAKIENLRMWFHLDGLHDTNHLYRRLTDWKKIERNAKTFLDAGGKGSWVFIVFKHNEHQVEEARELSKQWGFDEFIVKKTARKFSNNKLEASAEVWTPNGVETITYEPPENPEYIAEVLFSDVEQIPIDCYSEKRGTYYITCESEVYPCCVIGKEAFHNKHLNKTNIDKMFDYIDFDVVLSKNNTFNNVIDNYNIKEDLFKLNWQERKFKHCIQRCGQNTTCQKLHIPHVEGGGSKKFEGWAGPHNMRNLA